MIYTVTLNPSIDYIVKVDLLKLGKLNRMKQGYKLPGGKGINVSRVLRQLNIDTIATGFCGGHTGLFIEDWLRNENITPKFVKIQDDTRINIKLKHEVETEINGLGPVITEEESTCFFKKLEAIKKGDIVILSGSVPPTLKKNFYNEIIEICLFKEAIFVIDTREEALLHALYKEPFLIKPNHHELGELFGVKLTTIEEIIPYGKKCLRLGAQHVIVSMAGNGALLFTHENTYFAKPIEEQVKNSVGAGDAMVAGFIGSYLKTNDPVEAFKISVATGSATAFSTDLATANLIQAFIPKVVIEKL